MGTGHAFIGKFEREVFWDELACRLAQRDLLEEKGESKPGNSIPLKGRPRKRKRLLSMMINSLK